MKTKRYILLSLFVISFLFCSEMHSQPFSKNYFPQQWGFAHSAVNADETKDGDFVLLMDRFYDPPYPGQTQPVAFESILVKVNPFGNIIWSKELDFLSRNSVFYSPSSSGEPKFMNSGHRVIKVTDNNEILMAGNFFSSVGGKIGVGPMVLVKLDQNGINPIINELGKVGIISKIFEKHNGNYFATGKLNNFDDLNRSFFLMEFDDNLNIVWYKEYLDPPSFTWDAIITDAIQLSNNDVVVVGRRPVAQSGFIFKSDSQGQPYWVKSFSNIGGISSVDQLQNGDLVFCGKQFDENPLFFPNMKNFFLRTDVGVNTSMMREIKPVATNLVIDYFSAIEEAKDGSIYLLGEISEFEPVYQNYTEEGTIIVNVTSGGNVNWAKKYINSSDAYDLLVTSQNELLITADNIETAVWPPFNSPHFFKTDALGKMGCEVNINLQDSPLAPTFFQSSLTFTSGITSSFKTNNVSGLTVLSEEKCCNISVSISGPTKVCPDQNITLDAGGGYTQYQWSTGANTQTIQVVLPGVYSVTATDAWGCTAIDNHYVSQNNSPFECNCCLNFKKSVSLNSAPSYNAYTNQVFVDYLISSDPVYAVSANILGVLEFSTGYVPGYFLNNNLSNYPLNGLTPTLSYPPFSKEVKWGQGNTNLTNIPPTQATLTIQLPPIPAGVNQVQDYVLVRWNFNTQNCVACDTLHTFVITREPPKPWDDFFKMGILSSEKDPINTGLYKTRDRIKGTAFGNKVERWYKDLNKTDWVANILTNPKNLKMVAQCKALVTRLLIYKGNLQEEDLKPIEEGFRALEKIGIPAPEGFIDEIILILRNSIGMNWDQIIYRFTKIRD